MNNYQKVLLDFMSSSDRIGWWLSASLDDPMVCDEMKADVEKWFETFRQFCEINGFDWCNLFKE